MVLSFIQRRRPSFGEVACFPQMMAVFSAEVTSVIGAKLTTTIRRDRAADRLAAVAAGDGERRPAFTGAPPLVDRAGVLVSHRTPSPASTASMKQPRLNPRWPSSKKAR